MRRKKSAVKRYAFIDSQNLNLGTQRMGWKLDWRKFRQYLADKHNVTHAYMFIGYMSAKKEGDDKDSKEKEKEKPLIKGNVDAELVLYAMKELPNYDEAIIVSGDGDFFSLAEYLNEQGKLAHILTPNWQYSSLLKVFDDKIIRLDQMRRQLAYHDRKKK
jgi:uncharacterized LabA/DUF88 family protein